MSTAAAAAGEGERRSYWRCGRRDLFPEPSFQSWRAYRAALSSTLPRLRDRLRRRATDTEVQETSASEHPLRRCLTWPELALLGLGSVVGSGIFVITGLAASTYAGPAIPVSYLIAGVSALLTAFCYAELATEIPSAGGAFSYLRVELGDAVAFLAAGNILLEAVVGAAGLARSWTSYFAALIGRDPDALRIHAPALPDGFDRLDPIGVAVLVAASAVAASGAKLTSRINVAASAISGAIIVFIIAASFAHFDASKLSPFAPFGAGGVFRAAAILFWSYTGFDMVATMAEEAKDPGKDMPRGLLTCMVTATAIYCAMSLGLVGMQRFDKLDPNAAFSVAFAGAGMDWAKYIVALGALKGMTISLLVGAMGQARYTTQIARAHMIPPLFARVHPATGTPVHATALVTAAAAAAALFSSLDVLAEVSSISTLFIFALVAVALLVRRYYVPGASGKKQLRRVAAFLSVIVAAAAALAAFGNSGYRRSWIGCVVAGVVLAAATAGMAWLVPQQRAPAVFGMPLVPWLPVMSVAINAYLMGSLSYLAYLRFGICTAAMLVYYLLLGLHATFDVANPVLGNDADGNAVPQKPPEMAGVAATTSSGPQN